MSENVQGLSFLEKLSILKKSVKVAKGNENKFGHYKYRTKSDIYEAVNPVAERLGLLYHFNDRIEVYAGVPYLVTECVWSDKATGESLTATACAREPLDQSGMSSAQMTGSASTYAQKYCLTNFLNLVDHAMDNELDPDGKDNTKASTKPKGKAAAASKINVDTVTVNGKEVPKRYFDACMYEVDGERLLNIYATDRERFNYLGQYGDNELQANCAIIADYKLREDKQ